jgi:hypothetical protein
MQYKQFGDAITFDTTYRTNLYDMPFGLFVGVNNNFQSIILGGVLLTNERTETFEWVFKEFVSLMGGKAPVTILIGMDNIKQTIASRPVVVLTFNVFYINDSR